MNILIVKTSSLGDIIHAFPVVQYLKQCQPNLKIDWVVEHSFVELVKAHPLIDRVISVQTKKWRSHFLKGKTWREIGRFLKELRKKQYDLVLDLQGNVKSGFVTASAKSVLKAGFNYASVPEWPNLLATNKKIRLPLGQNIREDYLFLARSAMGHLASNFIPSAGLQLNLSIQQKVELQPILEYLKQFQGLKVLVSFGSRWGNKQLSKETWLVFLRCFLNELNVHFLFISGNSIEKAVAEQFHAAFPENSQIVHRLSLPALQNLMTQVDLVLAMDSLPLHLAGTTLTPTYSVFGASSAQKYKPIGQHHFAYQGDCPYGRKFEKRCVVLRTCKTGACIKKLEGKKLFEHFYAWWSSLNYPLNRKETSEIHG